MIEVWFRSPEKGWIKTREYKTVYLALEHIKKICRMIPSISVQDFKLKGR